ncbi:MAG: PGF-pre-PGF domain-containing protein [Haloarculaceae archaeon]
MKADWSPAAPNWRRLLVLVLATTMVASTAFTAAASPQIFVAGGKVQKNTALVGQPVNVTVRLRNSGTSDGALNTDITTNGSASASRFVQVNAGKEKFIHVNLTFDESGTYRVSANGNRLGVVEVRRARATERASWSDGRTVRVRGQSVATNRPQTVQFPSSQQPFSVASVTVVSTEPDFAQDVTTYANVSNASVSVPTGETATVVGAMTISDHPAVKNATVRFALSRSRLTEAEMDTGDVTLYHRANGQWEPLTTEQVDAGPDRVTYEATATNFSAFVVGSLEPAYEIRETTFETEDAGGGQDIVLTGRVNNTGSVAGEYTARMVVNDERVSTKTVRIPAGEQRTIRLNHTVTEAGTYDIGFNNRTVGTVQILASDVSNGGDGDGDTQPTETPTGTNPDGDSNEGIDSDGGPGLPADVTDLGLPYLLGGGVVVLVLILAILLVAERR